MSSATEPTLSTTSLESPERFVLEGVPWSLYLRLRANQGVRMAYDDGRLEFMSPPYRHEKFAGRLSKVVMAVTCVLDMPCTESRMTTFKRRGRGRKEGKGKEADTSFYIAHEPAIREQDELDLRRDPPPDLAIEVDLTSDSERHLPIYAGLRVTEVWRFDAVTGTFWFGRLGTDGEYHDSEASLSLPMLTPDRVLDWLRRGEGLSDSTWLTRLQHWIRAELPGPADGGEAR